MIEANVFAKVAEKGQSTHQSTQCQGDMGSPNQPLFHAPLSASHTILEKGSSQIVF